MTKFFGWVFTLRYVAILAIVAPFFGSALMMVLGTVDTVNAYRIFLGRVEPEGAAEAGEAAMIKLVASVDHFLFGSILMIFAIGLYALFFRTSSSSGGQSSHGKHLSWKQLKNLGGMDEMLLKVIIMLLAVAFLEFMLASGIGTLSWTVLVVPLAIIALALGLKWMSAASEEEQKDEKSVEKASSQNDFLDALERLAALHEREAITAAEYDRKKKEILNE